MTDSEILAVAGKITNEYDIFRLGFGLKLTHEVITANVNNRKDSLQMATYYMLQGWLNSQDSREIAFDILVECLGKLGLQNVVKDVFK